jgi:hypothetical protein
MFHADPVPKPSPQANVATGKGILAAFADRRTRHFLPLTIRLITQRPSRNPLTFNSLRCPLPTPLPIGPPRPRRNSERKEGRKSLKKLG